MSQCPCHTGKRKTRFQNKNSSQLQNTFWHSFWITLYISLHNSLLSILTTFSKSKVLFKMWWIIHGAFSLAFVLLVIWPNTTGWSRINDKKYFAIANHFYFETLFFFFLCDMDIWTFSFFIKLTPKVRLLWVRTPKAK